MQKSEKSCKLLKIKYLKHKKALRNSAKKERPTHAKTVPNFEFGKIQK